MASSSLRVVEAETMQDKQKALDGIKTILDGFAEKDPRARNARPEDFADMRFIRELDQSGFIDSLYSGKTDR